MSWVAVAIGGGALLSAGSGYLSGQSAQNAANKNQAFDQTQLYAGMARQAFEELGAEEGQKWILANIPKDVLPRLYGSADFQQAIAQAPPSGTGGSGMFAGPRSTPQTQYRTVKGTKGIFDMEAQKAAAGPGSIAQLAGAGEQQISEDNAAQNAMEGLAAQSRGYGNAMRAQVQRDADAQLAKANALTGAQARASGIFGGSYQAGQNASNAANIFQAKTDALTGLNMAEQNRTLGLQQGAIGQRIANADSARQIRSVPINARRQSMQSPIFNPYVPGQAPAVSPLGNAMGSAGNTLSGVGGNMWGQQNMQDWLSRWSQINSGGQGASVQTAGPSGVMSGGAGNSGSIFNGYPSPSGTRTA